MKGPCGCCNVHTPARAAPVQPARICSLRTVCVQARGTCKPSPACLGGKEDFSHKVRRLPVGPVWADKWEGVGGGSGQQGPCQAALPRPARQPVPLPVVECRVQMLQVATGERVEAACTLRPGVARQTHPSAVGCTRSRAQTPALHACTHAATLHTNCAPRAPGLPAARPASSRACPGRDGRSAGRPPGSPP